MTYSHYGLSKPKTLQQYAITQYLNHAQTFLKEGYDKKLAYLYLTFSFTDVVRQTPKIGLVDMYYRNYKRKAGYLASACSPP